METEDQMVLRHYKELSDYIISLDTSVPNELLIRIKTGAIMLQKRQLNELMMLQNSLEIC